MEYLIICTVAFFTSGLTLFSGFGLGTLLMPVFVLFFPVDLAVSLTAIVHFLNNLFKLSLVGKYANRSMVLRFGLPAFLAAMLGASMLLWLSHLTPLFQYSIRNRTFLITPLKLIVALLILVFALFETLPRFRNLALPQPYLPLGGLLSGFFGGLSGHQGALRSAFLVRSGLSKESFIGTGVMIACLIDFSRISVYASRFHFPGIADHAAPLGVATFSAFLGAWLGNRLLPKITLQAIQVLVSILLFMIAFGLGIGLI